MNLKDVFLKLGAVEVPNRPSLLVLNGQFIDLDNDWAYIYNMKDDSRVIFLHVDQIGD